MASVNKWIGIGNLGKDPEMRTMQNGNAVVSFSIACSESWKDKEGNKQEKTEWVNCTAFNKLGEICGKYLTKGKQVYIEGRLQTDKYEKDGQTRYSTKIIVSDMKMLGSKGDGHGGSANNDESESVKKPINPAGGATKGNDELNDDIPF